MPVQFDSICEGHLGYVKALKPWIEQWKMDSRLTHSALNQAYHKVMNFKKQEINGTLNLGAVEPTQP